MMRAVSRGLISRFDEISTILPELQDLSSMNALSRLQALERASDIFRSAGAIEMAIACDAKTLLEHYVAFRNVKDDSVKSDDLRVSARSTFERLREETRGREEEDLVSVGFGRYRLLMEGDVEGALDEISNVEENNEVTLLRETCSGAIGSEADVETWSPINRAAYYDSKEDYERSVETWNTCFEVKNESDDDEIAAVALTSLGRRLCLERTELGRADDVLQRAMRFYTKDPEHDKIRFSYTLAWLGAVQHAQEKAVTAEGLMRTATDTMKSLVDTMDLQETAAYCEALGAYARLLSEWDEREREAEKMQAKADSIESKLSKIIPPSFHVGGSWWDSTLFSSK